MKRLALLLLCFLLVAPGSSLAIREKQAFGVWKWSSGEEIVDTIFFKKQHRYERFINIYEPFEMEKADGSKLQGMKLSKRIVDRGQWFIIEGRVRANFKREVDGVAQNRFVDEQETYHTVFLTGKDKALVIDEMNDEAIPAEEQRAFRKEEEPE